MEIGIVGLPLSGKTTLFSTLTGQDVAETHTGGKIEVHRAVVKVPDERLDALTEIFKPRKEVYATIEYIEVGGLEKDTARSRGFDSQFLQVLKNTDLLCVVIRAFENEYHPHPAGSVDALRDIQMVEDEFLLSDLSIVENRIERLEKQALKAKDPEGLKELELMKRCLPWLESEKPLREMEFTEDEKMRIRGYNFLSAKPVLVVLNIGEEDLQRQEEILSGLNQYSEKPNFSVLSMCLKIEQEISQLEEEDAQLFLEDLGIKEPALNKLIRKSYDLLGLISFFTVGEQECHAWTIKKGDTALKAAGTIHSDFEKGFIRAEVIGYNDFMRLKSLSRCRDEGVLRLEGKHYIVQDGDIMTIRFNV